MKTLKLLVLALTIFSASPARAQDAVAAASDKDTGLSTFLFQQGVALAQKSSPTMFRDFVNNEWMYGAMYQFYRSDKMLPGFLPPSLRDKVSLPAVNFSGGLLATTGSLQGTPMASMSLDMTPAARKLLVDGIINHLPADLDQHLQLVSDLLKSDANGAGILSLGGAGGRDFKAGLWRGGVSCKLAVKFGGNAPEPTPSPAK